MPSDTAAGSGEAKSGAARLGRPFEVLLLSTYELGHQPFGLASPAAWLRAAGAEVTSLDLAVQALDEDAVRRADLVAIYVPMHTATKLAVPVAKRVTALNPAAHLCFYGLYAPVNEAFLRSLGAATVLGGEFEEALVSVVRRLAATDAGTPPPRQPEPLISLDRLAFRTPDRSDLPQLDRYAYLDLGAGVRKVVAYTEATRGCRKLCRHCPIVPVYNGRFRVVQRDVVAEDVRQQVAAGAQHLSFGDPDFFNAPAHAVSVVTRLHEEFPQLSYDVIIKIEHLLRYAQHLPTLRDTGCLFVTSAVESVDDAILERFDKRHTREQFVEVVRLFSELGLTLNPTFVTFTPWTTPEGYLDLLGLLAELGMVDNVPPVQWAIRLLVPEGSRLLELPEMAGLLGDFDAHALFYPWRHRDPRVDELYDAVMETVKQGHRDRASRREVFTRVWKVAAAACPDVTPPESALAAVAALESGTDPGRPSPSMSEPWYCCAEPTEEQLAPTV